MAAGQPRRGQLAKGQETTDTRQAVAANQPLSPSVQCAWQPPPARQISIPSSGTSARWWSGEPGLPVLNGFGLSILGGTTRSESLHPYEPVDRAECLVHREPGRVGVRH